MAIRLTFDYATDGPLIKIQKSTPSSRFLKESIQDGALQVSIALIVGGHSGLLLNAVANIFTGMTQLLEKAFSEASKLPDKEQNAVAALLLEELASEKRWDGAFASSQQQQLSSMAQEALREFEAGQTLPLDADRDFSHD
jgi:hypothetical protein